MDARVSQTKISNDDIDCLMLVQTVFYMYLFMAFRIGSCKLVIGIWILYQSKTQFCSKFFFMIWILKIDSQFTHIF